jgi:hypothetical protein
MRAALHVDCARKALPHLSGEFWSIPIQDCFRMWPVDRRRL